MPRRTRRSQCFTCEKEKRVVKCEGCLQLFCYDHFTDHRQELIQQLDQIEIHRDLFQQTLHEQTKQSQNPLLIQQIDQWEEDSIKLIQQTANECRQLLNEYTTTNTHQIQLDLAKLNDEIKQIRQENDFNEIDFNEFIDQLKQLTIELDKPSNVIIQQDSTPLINKISVIISSGKSISSVNIDNGTKWKQYGLTVAGGNGYGNEINQLYSPQGFDIDDDNQTIYVADFGNHCIVKWKFGAKISQVVAGGNGEGNRMDQLNWPTDVIFDKQNDSIIISDQGNSRVIRWSFRNNINQEIIISNIHCSRLTMDNNGDLYVTDSERDEVRRWKRGDTETTIVAGGNGRGNLLNQLNSPGFIFIDQDLSIYVSDEMNHRVMKWRRNAKEGIVIAGGQGDGNSLTQLSQPAGIFVDPLDNIYVADSNNHRIMRWSKGSEKGSIVVGGNGEGKEANQFGYPMDLSFDREGNLYVVDMFNHRIQKFNVD